MTTNVFDKKLGVLATDSRWSIPYLDWVIFLDDSHFEKIERFKTSAFMFAGKGDGIQAWKDWIRSNPSDLSQRPSPNGVAVCIVDTKNNETIYAERQDIMLENASFAGSGCILAHNCWSTYKDPIKAVETAKLGDVYSGGDVKYLNCVDNSDNLNSITAVELRLENIKMVSQAILDRGLVMKNTSVTNNAIPFRKMLDAAANDAASFKALEGKIANGEIFPDAPCAAMHNEWSKEEIQSLDNALHKVFGW